MGVLSRVNSKTEVVDRRVDLILPGTPLLGTSRKLYHHGYRTYNEPCFTILNLYTIYLFTF